MKRVHYTDSYLINPQHPVTVNLIGAGGTGSQVLTCLARLDITLRALGHPGLFVTLYDPDIVTESNIGRQLFSPSDVGLNKAQCLITRINNFFGNDWKAFPDIYPVILKDTRRDNLANITITCTDNIKSRLNLWNILWKMFRYGMIEHHVLYLNLETLKTNPIPVCRISRFENQGAKRRRCGDSISKPKDAEYVS